MKNTNFSMILAHLKARKGSIEEDFIFLRLVVSNYPKAVNYFVGEYSAPILRYVVNRILYLRGNSEYADSFMQVLGDYYMFIAAPFDLLKHDEPKWHRLSLYKAEDQARLYTYVFKITSRHFLKNKKKYVDREKNMDELLEYMDYEALLGYDLSDEVWTEELDEVMSRVRKAFASLKERDKEVLHCLVMDKMHWSDAFEELRVYLDPLGPDRAWKSWSHEKKQAAIDEYWTSKEKQDAMSSLKNRAISHLAVRYNELKKEENERK
ncbi:hypothetical protein [Parabacteroides sp.]